MPGRSRKIVRTRKGWITGFSDAGGVWLSRGGSGCVHGIDELHADQGPARETSTPPHQMLSSLLAAELGGDSLGRAAATLLVRELLSVLQGDHAPSPEEDGERPRADGLAATAQLDYEELARAGVFDDLLDSPKDGTAVGTVAPDPRLMPEPPTERLEYAELVVAGHLDGLLDVAPGEDAADAPDAGSDGEAARMLEPWSEELCEGLRALLDDPEGESLGLVLELVRRTAHEVRRDAGVAGAVQAGPPRSDELERRVRKLLASMQHMREALHRVRAMRSCEPGADRAELACPDGSDPKAETERGLLAEIYRQSLRRRLGRRRRRQRMRRRAG